MKALKKLDERVKDWWNRIGHYIRVDAANVICDQSARSVRPGDICVVRRKTGRRLISCIAVKKNRALRLVPWPRLGDKDPRSDFALKDIKALYRVVKVTYLLRHTLQDSRSTRRRQDRRR